MRRLADCLYNIASWMVKEGRSHGMQSKFVDLAPTDQADKDGIYSEAILFATNNAKVSNIALTGPYGSGKSSIIQSFLKKYRRPALHISLAAFVPEGGSEAENESVSRQQIERSILQQMLYGADANKLPLSRFKRIQSPGRMRAFFESFYIMLGFLALWHVFSQREDIISGTFFAQILLSNWLNLVSFILATSFLWWAVHRFYIASFGLSLKSISLKNVEIKPTHDDQASILNRHLDEIVYFFRSTAYDLVIIEDLDRFNNPEVFVTLREINNLINENADVKRNIRFLYALRDDMFTNTDRTKFFEFIIPVIPIINTSNSIDMLLKQAERLKIDKRLNRQFIREVSRYLNDLRLIQNIFNEYSIYDANLKADEENLINPNKLIAILIYKNIFPRDFEQLHRGRGNFTKILKCKEDLIKGSEATYRAEILELEKRLEIAERQTPSDLKELRQIYAMALIEKVPPNTKTVSNNRESWISIPELPNCNEFEHIINASRIFYILHDNFHRSESIVDIKKLQREVNPDKNYQQRKEEIESKAADNKSNILREINTLKTKVTAIRTSKLNELLRLNVDSIPNVFDDFGENKDLARFLILESYIDDTYYQYTSLFHSGRLSPNDNKFLIQIRAFISPEPSFPIDNPKEVIAEMRNEDFRQSYVLNVKLVDSLLSYPQYYHSQKQKLFEFISSEFERCEDFFEAYYNSGHSVKGLLSELATAWKDFVPTAIASPKNISHTTQLIASLPENMLESLATDFDELPNFTSERLPEILMNAPGLEPKRLTCLGFKVKNLAAIKEHPTTVHLMFEERLFELTIANLEYAYQSILGNSDLEPLRVSNFTTLRLTNSAALMRLIECDFERYFIDVLLELDGNSKEDASAIKAVLHHDTLNEEDLRKFLKQQTTQLPNLDNVPESLYSLLFELNMIEPTWVSCLEFMDSNEFKADSLVNYLNQDCIRATILEHPISGDTESLKLQQFLFNAGSLSDFAYREYVRILPSLLEMPPEGLEPAKLKILIDEKKIKLSNDSLGTLADNRDLQVLFVATNIDIYLADSDNFELDDEFREELLRSEIDGGAKPGIVELMDLSTLVNLPERSALIGPILVASDVNIPNLNGDIVKSVITQSKPITTQILLFNKYNTLMTNDEVRYALARLPEPFSKIKTGYNRPKLKDSSENRGLVKWLKSRDLISSYNVGHSLIETDSIRVYLHRR